MAKFQKKERRLVLEFGEIKVFVDVLSKSIQEALKIFAQPKKNEDYEVVKTQMEELIIIIVGQENYDNIKKELYNDEELNYYDLFDICEYILAEISNYNITTNSRATQLKEKYKK